VATILEGRERLKLFGPVTIAWDDEVLEPRPWTVAQAHWAFELAADSTDSILELHCGAGSIGLTAARLCGSPLVQVDDNPAACWWARRNADRLGIRSEVRCGTARDVLRPDEQFGIVLADPPYLRSDEVARYPGDPHHAVDGGHDGLAAIRDVFETVPSHLRAGAPLLLQVRGPEQAADVRELVRRGCDALTFEATRVVSPERAVVLLRKASIGEARPGVQ
jgi:release factor glutamine methyltransferase